ncbi:MAG: membrane protein insertase YidC [Ignavibacteriales bacterium]|nr:membrane protein insertase YidC [Ignavibacteriales bacterium]MCB9258423.1 membrane protein insertase YidC [Ignavibacteriales bacterium]
MDRQSTIAFILIGVILVFWLYLNAPEPQPVVDKKQDSTIVADNQITQENFQQNVESENIQNKVDEIKSDEFSTPSLPEKIITIDTKLARIELTSKGARIRKFYLKEYETWYHNEIEDSTDFYNKHVQLINSSREGGDFNIVFVTREGKLVNTKNLDFDLENSKSNYKVGEGDSLTLSYTYKIGDSKSLTKQFIFYGSDYNSKVDIILNNLDDLISSYRYDVEWSNGLNFVEENSVDEANYSNAAAFSGDEKVVIDASSEGETIDKVLNGKIDWVGVRNKYFTVIVAPEKPSIDGGADFKGENVITQYGHREYYSASLRIPFNNQKLQKDSFRLYIGPLEYNTLKANGNNYEAIFEFGSFLGLKFITRPISEYFLLPLFKFLHNYIPNYGWVIIVFSIILKFALYPLTKQSYKSMKRMSQLQPKIAELKEKHKGDQQKIQKETMKLYSTYGINPAGGCLPMLLQMPILFALFTFFNVAIEIRHEPFMWWITNLSAPDVIYKLPFNLPLFGISAITGLAPLLGLSMFFQQRMTMKDPNQKAMVYIMPFMMTFLFMGFSSGLNLYYFMFNILSIGQQYIINHQHGEELVPVKNPKKKSGFMQRMMEAAEQQQKAAKKRK